jgi:competence protein ComEC
MKLKYGKTSFLFTGDAEALSEKEMIKRCLDLSADVLKLGHHGSIRSTSDEFLEKVNPRYAVISVGRNNPYRHPHTRTTEKLKKKGIKVYRTDENGTIIAVSDGENITFDKKPGSYNYKN